MIWPPMNWLVYAGCRLACEPEAAANLAQKSLALLLKE